MNVDPSGNAWYQWAMSNANIGGSIRLSLSSRSLSSVRFGKTTFLLEELSPIPRCIKTISIGLDHAFTMINPIRSAIACSKITNLWDLMRLDGVTELPGLLSRVATGIGWGLSIAGGVIVGYKKYASGASLCSAIGGGIINIGISLGSMYASSAIATAAMGTLAASSLAIPGGIIIIGGAIIAIGVGVAINHLFTKLEIGGNTIEGYLNEFIDWLIFWD